MADLYVKIGSIEMKNPVMVASGTFGYDDDYQSLVDISKLGAIVTKSVTLKARQGNPTPRAAETPSGMLNTIGLQNKGVDRFIDEDIPKLAKFGNPIIVNIAGESIADYKNIAKILDKLPQVAGLEVNISCPNVKKGGMQFGVDPRCAADVIKNVRKNTKKTVIAKLSPNVTDIAAIGKSVERAGAHAISAINTVRGMAIDINTGKPKLSTIFGGLSGPAIRPIAVRAVWELSHAVKIPIIGMGGIMTADDAIEFIFAGASAIAVGTANFADPSASIKVIEGINKYLDENQIPSLTLLSQYSRAVSRSSNSILMPEKS